MPNPNKIESSRSQLYILLYVHLPIRTELQKECLDFKEKNEKTHVFFKLSKIWLRFGHPLAACTVPAILSNLRLA